MGQGRTAAKFEALESPQSQHEWQGLSLARWKRVSGQCFWGVEVLHRAPWSGAQGKSMYEPGQTREKKERQIKKAAKTGTLTRRDHENMRSREYMTAREGHRTSPGMQVSVLPAT